MHPQENVIFAVSNIIWQQIAQTSTAKFVVFGEMECGNAMQRCNKPSNRYGIGSISNKGDGPDETVIVSIEIEGLKWEAMLNPGAGISVTDIETLTSLGLDENITTTKREIYVHLIRM